MPTMDVDHIINKTPYKRFINAYNHMKENYTESEAKAFYESYSHQPLSFILENSRYIFSEPYYGTAFYESCLTNPTFCAFTKLVEERNKIEEFLNTNKSKMGPNQTDKMNGLLITIESLIDETVNTRFITRYMLEKTEDLENDLISSPDDESRAYALEYANDPLLYALYLPFVGNVNVDTINKKIVESVSLDDMDMDHWKNYIEAVIGIKKLSYDDHYMEAYKNMPRHSRSAIQYLMNRNLNDDLVNMREKVVKKPYLYASTESAIDDLYMKMTLKSEGIENDNDTISDKQKLDDMESIAHEMTLEFAMAEYTLTNEDKLVGYDLLDENVNVNTLLEEYKSGELKNQLVSEGSDAGSVVVGEPSKPKEPLTQKIQNKAMDSEARQMQHLAKVKKRNTEIANAGKAVSAPTRNIIQSIKDTIHKIDDKDVNRRKSYMTEPGFRKKIFRNIKLAFMYGTAVHVKLALVPVIQICRHFSKQKDRRVRNELVRELETEIKVCDEKINDASARDDKQEKYRLIRIKDKLQAEVTRVKYNSKYI